jgi:hypothetical protein
VSPNHDIGIVLLIEVPAPFETEALSLPCPTLQCTTWKGASFGVSLHPILGCLLELLLVVLELVGNARFNSIIRIRLNQEIACQIENSGDLVRRLPCIAAENAQTHRTLVIIADIGMIDLGLEAESRRLEWVLVGKD